MKLTIEHLKGYLGTGFKVSIQSELYPNPEVIGIVMDVVYLNYHGSGLPMNIDKIKPLLYPLSTLTEFRDDLGFVPMDNLFKIYNFSGSYQDMKNHIIDMLKTLICPQWILNLLYEWHFDIHGLIEKGLAIDKTKI